MVEFHRLVQEISGYKNLSCQRWHQHWHQWDQHWYQYVPPHLWWGDIISQMVLMLQREHEYVVEMAIFNVQRAITKVLWQTDRLRTPQWKTTCLPFQRRNNKAVKHNGRCDRSLLPLPLPSPSPLLPCCLLRPFAVHIHTSFAGPRGAVSRAPD